jgi:hypothetical protein
LIFLTGILERESVCAYSYCWSKHADTAYLERALVGDTTKMAARIVVMIDSFIVGKEKETIDNALSVSACQPHSTYAVTLWRFRKFGLGLWCPCPTVFSFKTIFDGWGNYPCYTACFFSRSQCYFFSNMNISNSWWQNNSGKYICVVLNGFPE